MADNRTRREKLQAMANDPGATQGERDNAKAILARMGEEVRQQKPSDGFAQTVQDILRRSREAGRATGNQWHEPYTGTSFNQGSPNYWRNYPWRNYSWDYPPPDPMEEELRQARERARHMTADQIKAMMQAYIDELERQTKVKYGRFNLHDDTHHDWVVVGTGITGAPINRCSVCAIWEYDYNKPEGGHPHEWRSTKAKFAKDEMWTQSCTICGNRRPHPDQPFYWKGTP